MSSLAVSYLTALVQHPVRTKALTSGTLNGLSELLAALISGQRDPRSHSYVWPRVPALALYGLVVSGPLSHHLVDLVQRAFRRARKGWVTNVAQIIALNVVVNPILSALFIAYLTILAGARNYEQVRDRVKTAFWPVLRSQWISSPLLIAFAQKYIPKLAWTPVFSFFAFILSTYHNTLVRKRLAEAKKDVKKE